MASPHFKLFALLLCLTCTSLESYAQNSEQITVQFVSFPKSNAPEPVELVIGDGKTIEVKIPSNTISEPYQVPAIATWAVGKTETNAEQTSAFKTYGQAPALSSKNQLIILLRKGPNNSDGMEVFPIDNQTENFGGGKFLFLNVTKVDIAGEVGDQKFVIKPGNRSIIRPVAEDGVKVFQTMFYFRKENEAKAFFSSKWPVNDKARSLVFFYHDPNNQRIRFHTIRDFLPE